MAQYLLSEIKYDLDGETNDDLPKTLVFETDLSDSGEIEEEASDFISDTTGFCHNGFVLSLID